MYMFHVYMFMYNKWYVVWLNSVHYLFISPCWDFSWVQNILWKKKLLFIIVHICYVLLVKLKKDYSFPWRAQLSTYVYLSDLSFVYIAGPLQSRNIYKTLQNPPLKFSRRNIKTATISIRVSANWHFYPFSTTPLASIHIRSNTPLMFFKTYSVLKQFKTLKLALVYI